LKRAFPQKVKPVSFHRSIEAAEQSKQAASGVNRRARTSAAMVGLALSMGAASLLLPRHGDGAAAAEPQAAEPQTTIAPLDTQAAVASPEATPEIAETVETAVESAETHRVRPNQTLWQIARKYDVAVAALAAANDLSLNSPLHPGQMLSIPDSTASEDEVAVVPVRSVESARSIESDDFKTAQDSALASMRQQRDRLQASLTQLQPSEGKVEPETAQTPIASNDALRDNTAAIDSQTAGRAPEQPVAIDRPIELEQQPIATLAMPPQPALPDAARTAAVNPAPVSRPEAIAYRVTSGDTLGKIADLYNIPQRVLAEANQIGNPNLIVVNQVLSIPRSVASAGSSETSPSAATVPPVASVTATGASVESQYYPMVTVPTVPVATPSATPEPVRVATVPPETVTNSQQTLAVASPTATPGVQSSRSTSSSVNAEATANPYVENLMAEILSMRERYRTGDQTAAQPIVVPTTPAPVQVAANPNVTPPAASSRSAIESAEALQVESQARQTTPVTPARPAATPEQLVAVAPLGAQNYAPLAQPVTGRLVSPDLPPLPSAEAYLPQGAPTFDGYRWPARGVLTSGYGWRWGRMHRGIDIGAPTGTPVVAAAAGEVVFAGWNSGGYGNLVEIRHPNGSMTRYAHNSRLLVRRGQQVEQGQQISAVGSTGYSTGPHLHFEVHAPNQGAVNPIAYLPRSRD